MSAFGKLVVIKKNGEDSKGQFKIRKDAIIGRYVNGLGWTAAGETTHVLSVPSATLHHCFH